MQGRVFDRKTWLHRVRVVCNNTHNGNPTAQDHTA